MSSSSLSILASFASLIHQGSNPDLENALARAPTLPFNDENQRPDSHHSISRRPLAHLNVLSDSNHYTKPHSNHTKPHSHRTKPHSNDCKLLSNHRFGPRQTTNVMSPRKVSMTLQEYVDASPATKVRHSTNTQTSSAVKRAVLARRHSLGTKRKSRDFDDYFDQYNYNDDENMHAPSLDDDDDDIVSDPDDSLIMTARSWSSNMDKALLRAVYDYGEDNWKQVGAVPALHKKTPKQCQYRWTENLKETNSGPLTARECEIIMENHDMRGNQWKLIADMLPGRTNLFVKHIWGEFISSSIMEYLAKHRGVELLALKCVQNETQRGRFVYKPGELRGAIWNVTNKISTMDDAAISFRRPSTAGSRSKKMKRKKYNHWSWEEDERLRHAVEKLGTDSWMQVALAVSGRNNKQCQERWQNHLDPDVNKKRITKEELQIIERLQTEHGDQPKMTDFVNLLPGRTAIFSRNNWHNVLRKKARRDLLGSREYRTEPLDSSSQTS